MEDEESHTSESQKTPIMNTLIEAKMNEFWHF